MLHHEKPLPRNPLAAAGNLLAVAGLLFALGGAALLPANLRPREPGLMSPELVRTLGYYLPLGLGLAGVYLGARGLHRIEERGGQMAGDWQGVFAVMIGGLAAVVGGVQVFATHVWPAIRASI